MARSGQPQSIRAASAQAFTLLEVLVASAIISFVVLVITHTVSAGHDQTFEARHQARALMLGEALLDEIARLPYADPSDASTTLGPEAGENTRADYDNADDYHGFPRSTSIERADQIKDFHGTLYPTGYQRFTRTVTCQYTSQTVAELGGTIDGLLITVTVTDQTGRTWTLTRFMLDAAEES